MSGSCFLIEKAARSAGDALPAAPCPNILVHSLANVKLFYGLPYHWTSGQMPHAL